MAGSKHPSQKQAECRFPVWSVSGSRHISAGALHVGLHTEPKCSHLQPFLLHGLYEYVKYRVKQSPNGFHLPAGMTSTGELPVPGCQQVLISTARSNRLELLR